MSGGSPCVKEEGEAKGRGVSCREGGFCTVQVSLVFLGGDMGDVQGNDALNKLSPLLFSGNAKLEKKVKKHNSKARRLITTKGPVRGKNPCDTWKD